MGLWGDSKKPSSETPPDKGDQVRAMAGYPDLATATSMAPSSTAKPASTDETSSKSRRATKSAAAQPPANQPTAEQIARERLRLEAMAVVGKDFMKDVAGLPYEVWSFMASDPELKLDKEEQEKLADSYWILAQSINPDFSSPWMLGFSLVLKNAALVGKRMKMLHDKEMLGKEENLASAATVGGLT